VGNSIKSLCGKEYTEKDTYMDEKKRIYRKEKKKT